MRLVDDLTLERGTSLPEKPGTTCTGVPAKGPAVEWELRLPGRPLLTVHDTRWDNGERDLVLYQPTVAPEIPAALFTCTALSFPAEDDETPVIAFTHLRVVPVLRHVGWLSMVAV